MAIAKFVAYGLSGSSAMFTEAIHSLVDSIDQVLLLIGQHRGSRPPDAGHPLGHGMESYFWSLIVAVMVLLLGGVASFYQGVRHIVTPEPLASPAISFGAEVVCLAVQPPTTSAAPVAARPASAVRRVSRPPIPATRCP